MAATPTLSDVLAKYQSQEDEITAKVGELEAEIARLKDELKEVRIVRSALEAHTGTTASTTKRAPAKPAAAPQPATPAKAAAPKPASAPQAEAPKTADTKPARKGRKGRRKPGGAAKNIHDMGIVDAAIALAKERNITKADAGMILDWFKEANYKTRNGTPTRNSIYVSLNREFTEGKKKGNPKVSRPARGQFVFHFENT